MLDSADPGEAFVRREAIRDLVARYNSYGDSGKFDLLLELFVPEAAMEIHGSEGVRRAEGIDEIRDIFTGTRERLRGGATAAGAAPRYMRHFTSTHQIDLIEDRGATGRLYFFVLMPHGLDHWGRYLDRYVVSDGRWRFSERVVRVDGRVPDAAFGDAAEDR